MSAAPAPAPAQGNALYTYRAHPDAFRGLQTRGLAQARALAPASTSAQPPRRRLTGGACGGAQDLSWDKAAETYEEVLLAAKYQW